MKFVLTFSVALWLASAVSADTANPTQGHGTAGRDWTPDDSVLMRYFTTPSNVLGVSAGDAASVVTPSPDGTRFFVITRRGDLVRDVNVNELFVFAVRDVTAAIALGDSSKVPEPLRQIQMQHSLNPAIHSARWDGNDAILFVGQCESQGFGQVYRLTVSDGRVEQLTDIPAETGEPPQYRASSGIRRFVVQGKGVIAETQSLTTVPENHYPVYTLTEKRALELLWSREDMRSIYMSRISYAGGKTWSVSSTYMETALARNGSVAVQTHLVESAPARWAGYDGGKSLRPTQTETTAVNSHPAITGFKQFTLIDLQRERSYPIFDAPTGEAVKAGTGLAPQAFWSSDARNVILVNTALPLGSHSDAGIMSFIVSYEVETGTYAVLEAVSQSGVRVKDAAWIEPGSKLLVRHEREGQLTAGTLYSYVEGSWKGVPVAAVTAASSAKPELADGLKIEARQSANDPAVVVATQGGREIPLFAPDQALKGLGIARTEAFSWRDSEGTLLTGVLTLPRRMPAKGSKVPLVIQIGIQRPDDLKLRNFRPEGDPSRTAYAAQALAAQDMFVLGILAPAGVTNDGKRELVLVEDWVVTATAALAQVHQIDVQKVGLVGFSRTGYEIRYMVTNQQERLVPAAAIVADSYTGSYYLTLANRAMYGESEGAAYDSIYGGRFHEAKSSWFEREVSFNVDKVRTPILFSDNGDHGFALSADTVGAFKANNKVFDYLFFPGGGGHQLTKPRSRVASMQATVDWMAFWLQGKTPADPKRAARWAALRKQQDEVLKAPPPAKGKWMFVPDARADVGEGTVN